MSIINPYAKFYSINIYGNESINTSDSTSSLKRIYSLFGECYAKDLKSTWVCSHIILLSILDNCDLWQNLNCSVVMLLVHSSPFT